MQNDLLRHQPTNQFSHHHVHDTDAAILEPEDVRKQCSVWVGLRQRFDNQDWVG